MERRVGIIERGSEMVFVGAKYFALYKFNRYRNEPLGVRLRLACESLGLVFIKLGQLLSTRYDLLSREDCDELQKLLDEVPPMDYEAVCRIFIQDFGSTPEVLYVEFDPKPIAAASIAQVYKARTVAGEKVAIKVRRPGVDRAIRSDIKIFRFLARMARWFSPLLRRIDLLRIINQLEEWLVAEVDFSQEIANLERVNQYYEQRISAPDGDMAKRLVFPKPFRHLSSRNVLVMSFIEGTSVRQWPSLTGNPDYDVRMSLEALMRAVLRAWLNEDELFFHGDPHPSNLVIMPHGQIGLLDFGLMGRFDQQDIQETRDLFLAVYAKNAESSARLALKLCRAPSKFNTPELQEDIRNYIEKTRFSGLGFWFMGFMRIFVKHGIPLPYQLVLFGRCQTILEGVFEKVLPGTTALDLLGEELERGMRRRILNNLMSTNVFPVLYVLSERLKNSPGYVAGIIEKYWDNPLQAIKDLKEAVRV